VTNLILTHILGKCFQIHYPFTTLKTATILNCCKNVSDKYFFHILFGIHLLINLSPDQNY